MSFIDKNVQGYAVKSITLIFLVVFLLTGCGSSEKGDVVILDVENMIEPVMTKKVLSSIYDIQEDDSIKAVVVRIDSPGGSVGSSQEIYNSLKKLAKKKPVVASMGSLSASGGYYIALGAQKIFANEGTITGSIGVRYDHYFLGELMKKVGIGNEILKTGKLKDISPIDRPLNAEERAYLEGVLNDLREQFVKAVSEERKIPIENVEKIADGRIIIGEKAKELNLIDEIGTIGDAVILASSMAGIKGEPKPFRIKPKKSFIRSLFEEAGVLVKSMIVENFDYSWR